MPPTRRRGGHSSVLDLSGRAAETWSPTTRSTIASTRSCGSIVRRVCSCPCGVGVMIEHEFDGRRMLNTGGGEAMDEVAAAWGEMTASRLRYLAKLAVLDRERDRKSTR